MYLRTGRGFEYVARFYDGEIVLSGREVANARLEDVHGDDPELGEEDPAAGVMGRRVPFGPFLALAALEFVLLRPQIDAAWEWLLTAG